MRGAACRHALCCALVKELIGLGVAAQIPCELQDISAYLRSKGAGKPQTLGARR